MLRRPEVRKARGAPGAYHFPMRLGSVRRGEEKGGEVMTGLTAQGTDHCQEPGVRHPQGKGQGLGPGGASVLARSLGRGLSSPRLRPRSLFGPRG